MTRTYIGQEAVRVKKEGFMDAYRYVRIVRNVRDVQHLVIVLMNGMKVGATADEVEFVKENFFIPSEEEIAKFEKEHGIQIRRSSSKK